MKIHSILPLWNTLSAYLFGKSLFSYMIRFINPYSGLLGGHIDILEVGHCEIILKNKRRNKNHLNSIHAIALANLGEFTSGMAVLVSLDEHTRGIVKEISIEYLKKARGVLRGVSRCEVPEVKGTVDFDVVCDIFNLEGDCVAKVFVTWQLGKI